MASALQCPACGHKHRLTALSGDPVFACEQCGRLLKTPVEYRRPEAAAPVAAPRTNGNRKVQRGGSATRDQTSVLGTATARSTAPAAAPASSGAKAASTRGSQPRPPAALALPLLVLGWVVAVLLGGVIVRYFAKYTGLVTGDSLIDILTGSGFGRYLRLFALVPFWALATAGLMTLFVEGGRRWAESRRAAASRPIAQRTVPPVAASKSRLPESKAKAASASQKSKPAAKPKPTPVATQPKPAAPAPAPGPTPAETRPAAEAGSAPRPRRIPKRDISS